MDEIARELAGTWPEKWTPRPWGPARPNRAVLRRPRATVPTATTARLRLLNLFSSPEFHALPTPATYPVTLGVPELSFAGITHTPCFVRLLRYSSPKQLGAKSGVSRPPAIPFRDPQFLGKRPRRDHLGQRAFKAVPRQSHISLSLSSTISYRTKNGLRHSSPGCGSLGVTSYPKFRKTPSSESGCPEADRASADTPSPRLTESPQSPACSTNRSDEHRPIGLARTCRQLGIWPAIYPGYLPRSLLSLGTYNRCTLTTLVEKGF